MLRIIKRWLGITALQEEVKRLQDENTALRTGTAVVTPDGKVAKTELPPKMPIKPRAHTWQQLARRREAEKWRDMCQEAFPGSHGR